MFANNFFFLLLSSLLITTFAKNTAEILSKKINNSSTAVKPSVKALQSVLHQRSKRFLIFEKGATMSLTVIFVKSIISDTPRGMSYTMEYTINYELPYTIETVFGKFLHHRKTTTTTTTTSTTVKPFIPWLHDVPHEHYYHMPPVATKWQQKNFYIQKSGNIRKQIDRFQHVCQPTNVFGLDSGWSAIQKKQWCKLPARKVNLTHYRRRQKRASQDENIFFDIIDQWAHILGYNGRHCAMRTLCEAQHMLLPAGQSLFHDVLRILIKFSTPRLQQDIKMQHALQHAGLEECANFYGPHCRLSFLQHFTQAIHGKLM